MASSASDPDEVLRSTDGKDNFLRLVRLLISGGTSLLREIFDFICPPSYLPTILSKPATEKQLKSAKLTKPQWDCLYPSPGVYGESTYFDVTLLFRLLRTICSLVPPATGWDALPASADHSLTADLARIKYYRNVVYGHVSQAMEISADKFLFLWQEISEALVRIAGQISLPKKTAWRGAIDAFLKDPITSADEKNIQELDRWYKNDIKLKKLMEDLKFVTQEGLDRLETSVKGASQGALRLEEELKNTTQEMREGIDRLETGTGVVRDNVQCLQTAVRQEAKDIKGQLGEMHQSINRLRSSGDASQSAAGKGPFIIYRRGGDGRENGGT